MDSFVSADRVSRAGIARGERVKGTSTATKLISENRREIARDRSDPERREPVAVHGPEAVCEPVAVHRPAAVCEPAAVHVGRRLPETVHPGFGPAVTNETTPDENEP